MRRKLYLLAAVAIALQTQGTAGTVQAEAAAIELSEDFGTEMDEDNPEEGESLSEDTLGETEDGPAASTWEVQGDFFETEDGLDEETPAEEDEKPYEESVYGTELFLDMKEGCTAREIKDALSRMRDNTEYTHMTVNIPAGEYECRETIYIYSNTTVNSAEGAHYYLHPDIPDRVIFGSNNWGSLREDGMADEGGYDHVENVEIQGGSFDGNNVGGELIRFIHGRNVTVCGAEIYNVKNGGHHLTLAGVDNALVDGCSFYGYLGDLGKEAIHLDVVHNSSLVPGTECYDDAVPRNITIQNCAFWDLARGIGSHSAVEGAFPENIVIRDNHFWDIRGWAIKAFHYKNFQISGNEIQNCDGGILLHSVLAGYESSLYPPLDGSYQSALPSREDGYDFQTEITGNQISGTADGIKVTASRQQPMGGIHIKDNEILSGGWGVTLKTKAYGNEVSGNYVEGMSRAGIYLSGVAANRIEGNQVVDSLKYGIYLNSLCEENKIADNMVSGGSDFGIYVSNSTGTDILDNLVDEISTSGIRVAWKSADTAVDGNVVSNVGGSAIYVTTSSNRTQVEHNWINHPAYYGILAKNSQKNISANYFYESGKYQSIALSGSKKATIKWNQFYQLGGAPLVYWNGSEGSVPEMRLMKVNKIAANSTKVTGTLGSRKSRVMAEIHEKIYEGTVKDRKFTLQKLPKLKRGTVLTVIERDIWGNTNYMEKSI